MRTSVWEDKVLLWIRGFVLDIEVILFMTRTMFARGFGVAVSQTRDEANWYIDLFFDSPVCRARLYVLPVRGLLSPSPLASPFIAPRPSLRCDVVARTSGHVAWWSVFLFWSSQRLYDCCGCC